MDEPEPPDVPAYVLDPLQSQSRTVDELEAIAEYCQQLAEYKQRPVESDTASSATQSATSVDDVDEALEDLDLESMDAAEVEQATGGSVQIYFTNCGPGCNGCPHGPYARLAWRDGSGTVRNKHLKGGAKSYGFSDSAIESARPD